MTGVFEMCRGNATYSTTSSDCVHPSSRHLPIRHERPLKAHGFSVQRPATRAKERDELVIAVWPKRESVALKKGAAGAPYASPLGRDGAQLPGPAG
jgi:hypothetical protein